MPSDRSWTAADAGQAEAGRSFWASGMSLVLVIAALKLALHCYFNKGYGYFRDEFDYMSCGDHLAWGYVDQPPLIPFLIHVCRAVIGDSLRSVRLIPALASSFLVVQTALLARELGGRRFALALGAVAVLIAPVYLSDGSLLTTNCLEPGLWMGCAWFALAAIKRGDPKNWLWFGVVAGLGLEEKYSIAVFVLGILAGLLIAGPRRTFLNRWIWLGGAAALVIFLPNLVWNIHHHWPFVELMRAIRADGRDVVLSPAGYFLQQMILLHPVNALLWACGLGALLFSPRLKACRALGWSYLFCYAVFFALHGKNYYLAPIYPLFLASGAVVFESAARRAWLKPATLALWLACGACLAPVTLPVLSPDRFIRYMARLPFKLPVVEHSHARAVLPQWYSDQFGWEEIVAGTAQAWNLLDPSERRDCGIFAQDYGQAGAIDFFGRRYGLPRSLSGHQSWFLWGPRGYSGNCLIVLDDRREVLEKYWSRVQYAGTTAASPYALESSIPVFICRGATFGSLDRIWPMLKRWR